MKHFKYSLATKQTRDRMGANPPTPKCADVLTGKTGN